MVEQPVLIEAEPAPVVRLQISDLTKLAINYKAEGVRDMAKREAVIEAHKEYLAQGKNSPAEIRFCKSHLKHFKAQTR